TTTGLDTTGPDTTTSTTGDEDSEGGYPATFATMKLLIRSTCMGAGCHDAESEPILSSNDDAELYGIMTSYVSDHCGGVPFRSDDHRAGYDRAGYDNQHHGRRGLRRGLPSNVRDDEAPHQKHVYGGGLP